MPLSPKQGKPTFIQSLADLAQRMFGRATTSARKRTRVTSRKLEASLTSTRRRVKKRSSQRIEFVR